MPIGCFSVVPTVVAELVNRQWCFVRHRPTGLATSSDFEWKEVPIPRPGPGEALVQNRLLSLDPTNRLWMWARDTYLPAQKLGDVMRGICVGTVVESNNPDLRVGTPVYGRFGWQDYAIVRPSDLIAPLPDDPSILLTLHLGLFGHIGMTAYFGLLDVAKPIPEETLVVSGAAGAVGSLVGQIGKIVGCRVIGLTGSEEKCRWVTQELGFDGAINYRTDRPLVDALARHCPHGIDVYFDNVGGETLEAALHLLNLRARIAVCGMISGYNDADERGHVSAGPRNLLQLVIKRARMEGFLVLDYWDRAAEAIQALAKWHQEGRLKYQVHEIDGLKRAPEAMNMLFDGTNLGKLIVRI
jgi:NADPH-dependent curcumin reductase CurA